MHSPSSVEWQLSCGVQCASTFMQPHHIGVPKRVVWSNNCGNAHTPSPCHSTNMYNRLLWTCANSTHCTLIHEINMHDHPSRCYWTPAIGSPSQVDRGSTCATSMLGHFKMYSRLVQAHPVLTCCTCAYELRSWTTFAPFVQHVSVNARLFWKGWLSTPSMPMHLCRSTLPKCLQSYFCGFDGDYKIS